MGTRITIFRKGFAVSLNIQYTWPYIEQQNYHKSGDTHERYYNDSNFSSFFSEN